MPRPSPGRKATARLLRHLGRSIAGLADLFDGRRADAKRAAPPGLQRTAERQFLTIADRIPALLWASDIADRCVFVNQTWLDYTGRRFEDEIGDGWKDNVHPHDAPRIPLDDAARLAAHAPYVSEYRLRSRHGDYRWFLDMAGPRHDDAGEFVGHVGVLLDITDRKRAEEASRESEERYRMLFERSPIALWEEDWSGIKAWLDRSCAAGSTDIERLLNDDPAILSELAALALARNVNETAVRIYRGPGKAELMAALSGHLGHASTVELAEVFRRAICAFWGGAGEVSGECADRTFDNEEIQVRYTMAIPPEDRSTWATMLLAVEDVTERKRTDDALRESRALLRAVIDAVPAMINVKDADGRYVLVNRYLAEYRKRPTEWFIGRRTGDIYSDDYAREVRARERHVIESGSALPTYEESFVEPDGRSTTWLSNKGPLRGEDGQVKYVVSVGLDITARKEAERKRQKSARLLRRAQQIAGLGHWTWTPDAGSADWRHGTTEYSETAASIFGLSPAAMVLTNAAYLERFVHPDDRARAAEAFLRLTLDQRDAYDIEYRVLRASGEVRVVHEIAENVLDERGRARYSRGTIQDVTERHKVEAALRESEQRFRSLADTVPALMWMSGAAGDCIFVNRRWLDYTGRQMADELGRGYADNIHPDDLARVLDNERETFAAGNLFNMEYRLRGADGLYRWFLDTGAPRFAADGVYLGHVGIMVDVTERRQIEEQLRQAQKMEVVGQLTGGIAHDFNNLLLVIVGNLDLLNGKLGADSPLHRHIDRAAKAADKAAVLTQRLLAFSREQPLQPRPTDLAALVQGMIELLHGALGTDIEVAVLNEPDLWRCNVDPLQMENALLNLAVNARDAMPDGGRLTIAAANLQIDSATAAVIGGIAVGDYVMVAVTDTGTGMPAAVQARAFEPFFTTKDIGKGSGLGLSMVYGFARQSGGQVRIYSEPGLGTAVKLYLPRAPADAAALGAADGAGSLRGRGEIVLVVEDEPDVRELAANLLEGLGYRPLQAGDGPAGLALLATTPEIALLLTDVVLPGGLSGFDLADEARRRRPGLKVLFTSGYARDALLHHGRVEGGVELLDKPFTRQGLALRLHRALAGAGAPRRH